MNTQKLKRKETKGITLIALVITIIVLLILAGVSIATLTGENGILTQAEKAKTQTKNAEIEEQVKLAVMGSYGTDGKLNYDVLKTNLNNIKGIEGVPSEITSETFPLSLTLDEITVYLNSEGKVSSTVDWTDWDKKAATEDCFIWESNVEGTEGYSTVIGYTEKIENYTKLRFPSRCTKIEFVDGLDYNEIDTNNSRRFTNNILKVEIPGTVTSIGFSAFGSYAYNSFKALEEVDINEGVTNIGHSAFMGCTNLITINIPESVTNIGNSAFVDTAWYNSQPDGVVYAGKIAYKYKGNISDNAKIELKDGTIGITNYAFSECTGVTSVMIPNTVTNIGNYAFSGCTNLSNITIPNSVTNIGECAFSRCTNLSKIIILDTVDNMGERTFEGWNSDQTIKCKVKEKPAGWSNKWDYYDMETPRKAQLEWGYTGD